MRAAVACCHEHARGLPSRGAVLGRHQPARSRAGGPARWSVTFAVDDVDAITARARELGGSVLAEPQNAPWVRFAVLADPAGASFTASQFVAENR